ncbi:MAG: 3-isopropylmalate dehydratase large subunit [Deltaproteobacteria bacterium]|jgi:3-isopropylmalate/(R)-2-methylmalate dehydratase large subunit|nr:3-isopropylmalate dehydratase large subunit [Deltaproteobacteria bacterium]
MGMTISEKILAGASGQSSVKAGDIVSVDVDVAMLDDILGPRVEIAEHMTALDAQIWDPDKVVVISDHFTPPATSKQAEIVKFTREWSERYGVRNYYEFIGPCHQIMVEKGHVLPGALVLGTDSHTCMGGALSAFASGVGSTEMLGILVTGKTWLKVPETIKIVWKGKLPDGVMAKDMSLATIKKIRHAGATYMSVEYVGPAIDALGMDERFCITNMAVEMGAKAGLMNTDATVENYLHGQGLPGPFKRLQSDVDASFRETFEFDATELEPLVSCPHEVDNVCAAGEVPKGTRIDQAYLGSCTGGRYTDLAMAAKLLKGRKVRNGRRLLVSPSSKSIWEQAAQDGVLQTLSEAGAIILAPTCGVCVAQHSGILADGETCISSTNRNFLGRMGNKKSFVYLGSPLTVAASAVTGEITDPREFL